MSVYIIKRIWFKLFPDSVAPQGNMPPKSQIRLPKIELPSFYEDITTFSTYYQMFPAVIHTSCELSDIEKFNYLISSLKGEELTLVQLLSVTTNNYKGGYDTLIKRYTNDRQALKAHWNAIENTRKMNSDNPVELLNLLNSFSKYLKAINNFRLPVLVQRLFKRLDVAIITRFELHYNSREIPTYNELINFLVR